MKKFFYLLLAGIVIFQATGCATLEQLTQPNAKVDNNAGTTPLPPYNGPKARIAVADFEVKAAKASGEIGTLTRRAAIEVVLCYPNSYRVAGSSLGMQVIYRALNSRETTSWYSGIDIIW